METKIRLAGMGGQGIIFAGVALARAAALYERPGGKELYAIHTQAYGPAARGEVSRCDVVISDRPEFYPLVERPDYLVIMAQVASDKYLGSAYPGTIVILDPDTVGSKPELTYYEVPCTATAKEVGARGAANMIMLGAFSQISGVISREALSRSVADVSPLGSAEANERGLREGIVMGRGIMSQEGAMGDSK